MGNLLELLNTLDQCKLNYKVLSTVSGGNIVVLERGARVIGAFANECSNNFLWTNPNMGQHSHAEWNIGGDRIWLSPEIEFHIPDHTRSDSYEVQYNMDPGNYQFIKIAETETVLEQQCEIRAFRSMTTAAMNIRKKLSLVKDPLSEMTDKPNNYGYIGYEQETILTPLGSGLDLTVSLWSILQVPFNGIAFISTYSSTSFTDFVKGQYVGGVSAVQGGIIMDYNGEQRRKISVKAAHSSGRLGYFSSADGEDCTLIVRNFAVNPSAHYPDVPMFDISDTGYCAQCYKDDGSLAFFGELEYHTPSINLQMTNPCIQDQSQVWCYQGTASAIDSISNLLLGYKFIGFTTYSPGAV